MGYDKRINDHMKGIDWDKPVEQVRLDPGERVDMWVRDGRPPGDYGTTPGTTTGLGIEMEGRHLEQFVVGDQPITVLRSSVADFPTGVYQGVGGTGGATQYLLPPDFAQRATRVR